MWPSFLLVIYCALLIMASLVGGWFPIMVRLTHTRMQLMMSLVGGLMMGVALLHLLPHAVVETNSLDYAAWSCTLGLLAMFLTIRVFHVHQHGPPPEVGDHHEPSRCDHVHHDHQHVAEHDGTEHDGTEHNGTDPRRLSWIGLFFGLAIHSALDGVAVGASLAAGVEYGSTWGMIGAGTFLAVFLHKPLDSLSITSVMAVSHWSTKSQSVVNLLFSLICPIGLLLTYFGVQNLGQWQHIAVGCALGFSAGVFLCISLADILPEIQFHRHDRVKLTAALLLGVVLAFGIGLFEPKHAHDQHTRDSASQHDHEGEHQHEDEHQHASAPD